MSLASWAGVLIFVVGVTGIVCYGMQSESHVALEITAPTEPELALPVYAQFTVTQTMNLKHLQNISAIEVPVYIPLTSRDLVVDLRHDGRLVERWRRPVSVAGTKKGMATLELPFVEPRNLNGSYELTLAAASIAVPLRDEAPRVFIESADDRYPDGHYRIAANDKSGDVGLRLVQVETVWSDWVSRWQRRPWAETAQAISLFLALSLFSTVPNILVRVLQI